MVEAGPREQAALETAMTEQPDLVFDTTGPDLRKSMGADWPLLAAMQARGVPSFWRPSSAPACVGDAVVFALCAARPAGGGAGHRPPR